MNGKEGVTQLAALTVATVTFVGTHFLLSHPLRAAIVRRIGDGPFLGLYSLVAAITFGWMVWAAWTMPSLPPCWIAPLWFYDWVAPLLMLLASILLVGSFIGNPAFPDPKNAVQHVRPATGVFAITRHPMNWAIMLWALTHIVLSGKPTNLVVASGLFVLTFVGSLLQDRKKNALLGDAWRGWETRTSFVPFGALIDGRIPWRAAWPGAIATFGGLLLWAFASFAHRQPIGIWRWLQL